jgi:transcriptional regulator with XRE-family HTH domain
MGRFFDFEIDPMTQDEKEFFKAMGARIAQLRKDSSITQVQLAQVMEVSQQTVTSWEVGRRGVPVSAVPALARALGCTVETLVGEKAATVRRGPAPKLQQHMERINQLPKPQQRFVMQVLESVLAQASR